jgi:hypothetical protein
MNFAAPSSPASEQAIGTINGTNAPGRYHLQLSLVQEEVACFDDLDPANRCGVDVVPEPTPMSRAQKAWNEKAWNELKRSPLVKSN